MSAPVRAAVIALGLLCATPLAAQRAELALLGGIVQSTDEEFDRVTASPPPANYTRERGKRESGAAFGAAATFAVRGHWFGELGFLHHGVERSISRTGTGDPSGPFLLTTTTEGSVTSFWMGPSYRVVDRERVAVSALLAPALFLMQGDAYSQNAVYYNAPSRSTEFGLLAGIRARYWASERIGIHLAIEDAYWAPSLTPHPSDGPFSPENYTKAPRRHEIRAQLGVALKLR
jgi:hypothetical protein